MKQWYVYIVTGEIVLVESLSDAIAVLRTRYGSEGLDARNVLDEESFYRHEKLTLRG